MNDILQWLVIPGGPGMSNNYLQHTLPQAFTRYNLHFYDAYGAPESEKQNASIEEMIEQIEEKVSDFITNEGYGLIAHSFGSYLSLRMLEKNNIQLKAIIMVNPMPFTYEGWKVALENIVQKIPSNVLEEVTNLAQQSNTGKEIFRLIYPYYVGNPAHSLPLDLPFNMEACNLIASKVHDFNEINLVSNSTIPIIRIVGELDSFYMDNGILEDSTLVLKSVGHYPFFEDSVQFINAVEEIEELLCQKLSKMETIKFS